VNKENIQYYLIRILTFPFGFLPFSWIHAIGRAIGIMGFYCMRQYRKRALSNLSLARDLALKPEEMIQIAKQSFQNLAINCLEYPKLAKSQKLANAIQCVNPEVATSLYKQGKGIIFFCGHQSNWEVLFLDGNTRMKGVAIGKAIKNKRLYNWILSIRERNGGKIISPQNAVREGFRALKRGVFMGIVGDQGMPDSGYSFPFLGRIAWTSTAPALLAYKTGCPIIYASTKRVKGGYRIHYSDPIWPDIKQPIEAAVVTMMDQVLSLLQENIKKYPGEWLWQHNRWKQQSLKTLYKRFRMDCICIILPQEQEKLDALLPHLATLKMIYANDFVTVLAPKNCSQIPEFNEILYYTNLNETLLNDYRFKLVFNFADYAPVKKHYEKLSVFEIVNLDTLKKIADEHLPEHLKEDITEIFKRSLCRPGSIWQNDSILDKNSNLT
jgi:Kdo2-lipid IVA lauroyltransferase/acyltransferase